MRPDELLLCYLGTVYWHFENIEDEKHFSVLSNCFHQIDTQDTHDLVRSLMDMCPAVGSGHSYER